MRADRTSGLDSAVPTKPVLSIDPAKPIEGKSLLGGFASTPAGRRDES